MLEVEAKLRLGREDAARLRARLRDLGALRGGFEVQEDLYFTHPARDLAAGDEALRLRRSAHGFELTYKGPRLAGPEAQGAKARQEATVRLRDDPTELLALIGCRPAARVRKRRESWALGELAVCIDDVEGLGEFAEVEALGADVAAAASAVEAAVRQLGLSGLPRVAKAYVELLRPASP